MDAAPILIAEKPPSKKFHGLTFELVLSSTVNVSLPAICNNIFGFLTNAFGGKHQRYDWDRYRKQQRISRELT